MEPKNKPKEMIAQCQYWEGDIGTSNTMFRYLVKSEKETDTYDAAWNTNISTLILRILRIMWTNPNTFLLAMYGQYYEDYLQICVYLSLLLASFGNEEDLGT